MEAVRLASGQIHQIKAVRAFDADPTGQLLKPELGLEITLGPGLSQQELQQVLTQFGTALQTQEFLAMVDSFTIKILAG
jgi:Ca2+-binding EF-hand superfamily protein